MGDQVQSTGTRWFYVRSGRKFGPVSHEHIMGLVERGRLQAGDLAWHEGLADWIPVERLRTPVPMDAADADWPLAAAPTVPLRRQAGLPLYPRTSETASADLFSQGVQAVARSQAPKRPQSGVRQLWWLAGAVASVLIVAMIIALSTSSPIVRFLDSMEPFADQVRKLVGRFETSVSYADYNAAVGELARAYTAISADVPTDECRRLTRSAEDLKTQFQSAAATWRSSLRADRQMSYLGRSRLDRARSSGKAFLAEYDRLRRRAKQR